MVRLPGTCGIALWGAVVALTPAAQCPLQWSAGTFGGTSLIALSSGDVAAIGSGGIAIYDGVSWQQTGASGALAAGELPGGELLCGGRISAPGLGTVALARWDGTSWSTFAPPPAMGFAIRALAVLPGGDVAVAGTVSAGPTSYSTTVELWDGNTWRVIGSGVGTSGNTPFSTVFGLGVLPSGDLLALGNWLRMDPVGSARGFNELVRWDGSAWHYLGDTPEPAALLVGRAGRVFVGTGTGVLHRDPSAPNPLVPLGNSGGAVWALAELPNGDVVAGGDLVTPPMTFPVVGLQRWDGTSWSSLGFGSSGRSVFAVAFHASGQLLVSGTFSAAGGVAAPGQATATTPCPAGVASTATACVGPVGPVSLRATAGPWLGGTFGSTVVGLAPGALGIVLLGAGVQQVPLAQLHPAGAPACDLLVLPDSYAILSNRGGVASYSVSVPNDPTLVQAVFYHQCVQLGLGSTGVRSMSSSNRLTLRVGVF